MGTKWRKQCIAALLTAAVSLCGCAKSQKNMQDESAETETGKETQETSTDETQQASQAEQETQGKENITIWLDTENEYMVRDMAACHEANIMGESSVRWNLVDKSYLTKAQYQQEFAAALEEGTAPDLIYMDRYNGLNPKELMGNSMLYGITEKELLTRINGGRYSLVESAREAGMQDGMYYILPLYMECPVVFGLEEDLKEAGIKTEEMYGSLEEFLEVLLTAHEKTGKLIFENTKAVDWLETYYMPEDAAQEERIRTLLEKVRKHCGDDNTVYGAYHMLDNEECLLGGCGVPEYRMMCADMLLFGEERTPAVLAVPDSGGELRGIITHAVAINAGTAHPEEAKAALDAFKLSRSMKPDVSCVKDSSGIFEGSAYVAGHSTQKEIAAKAGKFSDGLTDALAKYCFEDVSAVSFVQEYRDGTEPDGHGHAENVQTLYIHYNDYGDRGEHPYTIWLDRTAEAYEAMHEGTHVQLTPVQTLQPTFEIHEQRMARYGMTPDMEICGVSGVQPDTGISRSDLKSADFTPLFEEYREETSFLPESLADGIVYGNGVTTLPIAAEEFGIWYSRSALKEAGLPEDWRPEDMAELTEGLEQLNGLSKDGNPYTAIVRDTDLLKALSMFAIAPGELLKLQEDKSWALSREAWKEYLSYLTDWRDKGLTKPVGYSFGEVLKQFANESIGAYIGSSTFLAWIDADVVPLTEAQKEDLTFVQLSPAANMQMFFVPAKSEHAEDAFLFWLEAMRQPEYEELIKQNGCVPVTELPDDIISLPNEEGNWKDMEELLQSVWNSEKTAEEVAEEYQWYDFAEES